LYEPVLAKDVFLVLKPIAEEYENLPGPPIPRSVPGRSGGFSLSIGLKAAWSYWGLDDFAL
jgi:hypothetical protein